MTFNPRRIAISTGGGDAPGLNAVIQAVVYSATGLGWQVFGIQDGYDSLLKPQEYRESLTPLDRRHVRNIAHLGGTILGTTNRSDPFAQHVVSQNGVPTVVDRSDDVVTGLHQAGVDTLVAVGGDGSLEIAERLHRKGLSVVGVPKTIDNDLEATTLTFGFDSAVAFATECIDRLHSTADAHRRIIVVEVMGRHAGWIALNAGIAGAADAILIPEIPHDLTKVAAHIDRRMTVLRPYAIVVVAEGALPIGGSPTLRPSEKSDLAERLGGIGEIVARKLQQLTKKESRAVILGHLLRGGSPTALDRLLGLSFGAAAVRALNAGHDGVMVALNPPDISYVPLARALERLKVVPSNGYGVMTARALDISLGD
jgi:ATP-dependent phosphofructokinase / diphosphate-dependent phosphofructokinase